MLGREHFASAISRYFIKPFFLFVLWIHFNSRIREIKHRFVYAKPCIFSEHGSAEEVQLTVLSVRGGVTSERKIIFGDSLSYCEDTSHQAISMSEDRVFDVKDDECVACNLCVNVCPVDNCITMETLAPGAMDERTGQPVEAEYGNWLGHPNNPSVQAAE